MFYEVRIYNAKKKLKKILSSQELSRRYWKKIKENDMGLNPGPSKIKSLSAEMRRKLDEQIPEFLPH
jgi:hypothetical protein